MRVAIALGGTDYGCSGLGSYVRAVVPRLARQTAASGGALIALGTLCDFEAYSGQLAGVEQICVPRRYEAPAVNAMWHLFRAGDWAQRANADVLLLAAANRRVSARSPVPTVAVVHDLAQLHVRRKYDPLRMAYLRYAVIGALKTSRQLVAISNATRDDLVNALGLPASRVMVVPNGVEAARFSPATSSDPRVDLARKETGLTKPYVLYPSRLEHPGKNHLRLVRGYARSRVRESHLLALAGGDWGAGTLIDAEIATLGLTGQVIKLGYVAEEILPGLFAGADAVAMVGLAEGFGLPALEALAAGRPVIAARTGALPEVVGPLAAYCDPLDEASIATALERAVYDSALREKTAHEGPVWAAARDWDATATGLLSACHAAKLADRQGND